MFGLSYQKRHFHFLTLNMPTKPSNAQHLVEYEQQLLYEEYQKSGNLMQQPMDSYVCGIYMSSESILIRSYLLFA